MATVRKTTRRKITGKPGVTRNTGRISQDTLHHLLDYDPETGLFTWKNPTNSKVMPGDPTGLDSKQRIHIYGQNYRANRLAWLYTEGYLPEVNVVHIDGNPHNNSRKNLTLATPSCRTLKFTKHYATNKTSYRGVCQMANGKFRAYLHLNGKFKHLGVFRTPEAAARARLENERCLCMSR